MKKMTNAEINEFIKAKWKDFTNVEIAKMLNTSETSIRRRASKMGLPPKKVIINKIKSKLSEAEQVQKDLENKKTQVKSKDVSKKYNFLLKENEELKKLLEVLQAPREYSASKIIHVSDSTKSEATAVVLLSDWHVDQIVDGRRLAYPNTYNPEIAKQRAEECFIGLVKLIKKEQTHQDINTLVMALLGDFITGNIHLSEIPNLSMGVAEACFYAEELLIRGIQYVLDNTDVKIICPTSCGNHSRITEKVWLSSEQDFSLETIIYFHIKKHFENEKRFELIMPYGPDTFMEIYGITLAFCHGHLGYNYSRGIGGLYVPVRRAILTRFARRKIDLVCMGHFHSYIQDLLFLINGSLIGWDDYANSLSGLSYDIPKQTFFLLDKGRKCRTVTTPIVFKI